jgi:hypothetical protein
VRVERTSDRTNLPLAGFEDREDHRTPFASAMQPVRGASSTRAHGQQVWRIDYNRAAAARQLQTKFRFGLPRTIRL